jgi:putative flippase GtrA
VRTPDRLLTILPEQVRSLIQKRRETVKFLVVGGTCFLITTIINYLLKLTILRAKPVSALIIAIVVATIVSYVLNREWSFNERGGHRRQVEMTLFVVVNLIGIGINAAPQYIARYVFDLEQPHISYAAQEVSDLISGLILGTALAMFFRLWAFRAWVFPQQREPLAGRITLATERKAPAPLVESVESLESVVGGTVAGPPAVREPVGQRLS